MRRLFQIATTASDKKLNTISAMISSSMISPCGLGLVARAATLLHDRGLFGLGRGLRLGLCIGLDRWCGCSGCDTAFLLLQRYVGHTFRGLFDRRRYCRRCRPAHCPHGDQPGQIAIKPAALLHHHSGCGWCSGCGPCRIFVAVVFLRLRGSGRRCRFGCGSRCGLGLFFGSRRRYWCSRFGRGRSGRTRSRCGCAGSRCRGRIAAAAA